LDVSGVLLDNVVLKEPRKDFSFLENVEKEKIVFGREGTKVTKYRNRGRPRKTDVRL
jgi:hypothetical protein